MRFFLITLVFITSLWSQDTFQQLLTKAKQGDHDAQHELALAYYDYSTAERYGIKRDFTKTVKWLKVAIKSDKATGNDYAFLGSMYANGEGVAMDPKKAYQLFRIAEQKGENEDFVIKLLCRSHPSVCQQ